MVAGGVYRIDGIPAGNVRVLVHRVGWNAYTGGNDASAGETQVTLAAGERRTLDLTLP